MDGSSYFRDAHHFKVDSLNLNSHSGAHNDYRRSDVRNIYQGGDGNAYHTHLDSRRQDYGNRYATTNHNRGQSYNYNAPVNHYNAPTNATYYYTTHAQGSSVINGNFTGVQYNWNPGKGQQSKEKYIHWSGGLQVEKPITGVDCASLRTTSIGKADSVTLHPQFNKCGHLNQTLLPFFLSSWPWLIRSQ
ncbi:hypothetical protein FA13DRAFT_1794204 [Coprinellus micaceus]|uniref:Uncharacterized protein n=1 Tax=Coprinellus micaceus TaxID=71717 RepID=A0A4Y7T235_COPMI|nr:hypothetical protein FA13DRAFT_1794204 [Coprinellus micaceus]